ncbi:MAG: hypothetical protein HUU15_19160, partial [Candidatus Brocadiae bacterium]|nr:hypothetical protein [Candidatus Brocadiia bacterium]
RHQAADGRWAAADFDRCCTGALCSGHGDPGNDVGLTSLALLAFLGAGYTPRSAATWTDPVTGRRVRPGEVVRNGLRWLLDGQDREGFFAPRGLQIYNHSLATMAVCEARGLSGATLFEAPARRGLEALVQAQNPYKAWRYFDRCGDNDTSNTGFAMMAFHSASLSGLHVPQSSLDWVRGYLDEVTDPYGPVGYMRRGDAGAVQYRRTEDWKLHRSMTGVGVMCRVFLDGGPKHGSVAPGVALLAADPPAWAPQAVDSYYWYYGTLAMFLATDPESGTWRRWNEAMVAAVVPHQRGRGDGCREGSWDPEPDRIAMEGAGRVYMTAINVLTLQVYYRYPRAFGVRK